MPPLNSSHGPGISSPRKRLGNSAWILPGLILCALFSFATAACTQPSPAQTANQQNGSDPAASSKPQPRKSPRTSNKADGAWHHFGESASASAQPQPRPRQPAPAPGVWHHFGSAGTASTSNSTPAKKPSGNRAANTASSAYGSRVPVPKAAPRRSAPRRQYATATLADLQIQMLGLINRDRRNAGVRPLRWNAKLAAVALAHSRDMIRQGYFAHVGPDGKSVGGRLSAAGIDWQAVGENIAIEPTMSRAETDFMDEPRHQQNHRWNILNSGYTEVGVGIVRDSNGDLYITQDFMKPSSGR